jgi:hypothetical protein
MQEPETKLELDILKNIEHLTERINGMMAKKGESAFRRYPLTFTMLVLFGVIAVSEGVKGVFDDLGIFAGHPWWLLILGLVILMVTGTLYKKLDK